MIKSVGAQKRICNLLAFRLASKRIPNLRDTIITYLSQWGKARERLKRQTGRSRPNEAEA